MLLKDVGMAYIETIMVAACLTILEHMQDQPHIILAAGEIIGGNYVAIDNFLIALPYYPDPQS
jgi:hypothetical protein